MLFFLNIFNFLDLIKYKSTGMLLDVSHIHTSLENLGTTLVSLYGQTTSIIFSNYMLNFLILDSVSNLVQLWPTEAQKVEISAFIPVVFYTTYDYLATSLTVLNQAPHLYTLDAVGSFFLKNIFYTIYLNSTVSTVPTFIVDLHINFNLNIFSDLLFNKWSFFLVTFFVVYFFTNVVKFRYQYGFNFYFTYFKTLSDLGEQEYGSYDDYKFFVFFLVQMFVWYCWIFFVGYTFSVQSDSKLILLTISVMITILTIPVRLLWDFGLAFGMYVRGAASSSNLIVEAFFDIIGVIIVFTRFVVQNIRFLLVFVAFFELFEWAATTLEVNYFINLLTPFYNKNFIDLNSTSFFAFFTVTCKTLFIYLYHLLHLIIISFMQIGVYLMVSFWLFFFLYTSFFKLTLDNYFFNKRN